MSETPPQPKNPQVLGMVTPEEAALLTDTPTQTGELDANTQAVLERLGATGGDDRGEAFALVVGKDENGEDVPLHYVDVRKGDLGTTIRRPQIMQEVGLSTPREAYDVLIAQQNSADMAEVDTAQSVSESAAEQTREGTPESQPHSLTDIDKDSNKLLESSTLHAVITDPTKLLPVDAQTDPASNNKLKSLQEYAKAQIVAPEAAALISKELRQRTTVEIRTQVQNVDTILTGVTEHINQVDGTRTNLDEQLYMVKGAVGDLQNMLNDNPRNINPDDVLGLTRAIHTFSDRYSELSNRRHNAITHGVEGSAQVVAETDTISTGFDKGRARHSDYTNEALQKPGDVDADVVTQAVAARSSGSIAEHKQSAVHDVEQDAQVLEQVGMKLRKAEVSARSLTGNFRQMQIRADFPHSEQIAPLIDGVGRTLGNFLGGNISSKYLAQDLLSQLQSRIIQIERANHEEGRDIQRLRGLTAEVRAALEATSNPESVVEN